MNVSYIDFWPGFDVNCNWFNLLLRGTYKDRSFNFNSHPNDADIIFFSCFGNTHKRYAQSKAVKILYIGENIPADFSVADYCLSFDYDEHDGRNFRLPHWYLYINWWNESNFPHARISLDDLSRKYTADSVINREKFCSIIIGNPVPNRIEVARKFDTYKSVDRFGAAFNNHYPGCKLQLLRNYRWNICFENSITEGYVTEKLLEAKIAGCVPIYYGPRANKDFNNLCYINYQDYENSDDLLNHVMKIERDKEKFYDLINQPLFNSMPSLVAVESFLRKAIK